MQKVGQFMGGIFGNQDSGIGCIGQTFEMIPAVGGSGESEIRVEMTEDDEIGVQRGFFACAQKEDDEREGDLRGADFGQHAVAELKTGFCFSGLSTKSGYLNLGKTFCVARSRRGEALR